MTSDWPMAPSNIPDDAARQQAVDALTMKWRRGELTREEFSERLQQVMNASVDELQALIASTEVAPIVHDGEIVDSWASEDPDHLPQKWAPEGTTGQGFSLGIMGGTTLADRWTIAESHLSVALMGGNDLDLRDATFTAPVTTITVFALMGGVDIIVPPELDVEVQGVGIMGGFGWENKKNATPGVIDHQGPKVIVRGVAIMGGVGVTRKDREE